ncbi:hypothetical protein TUM20985_09060 [Mycobacterium antarcticum]|uniref:DUF7715 family protein n=1 Tax=unclassified Mycolicibacterium TaxID=2636767 RepID=UPI00238CDA86|nr:MULTISPECIES: hypothetical protein [unclassified Mycolicibacterium]BDX30359.1 hypothetical protein TUM20985_09060 [Mycolicibacterium sp. TUM20985]GLP73800.1 hypothetical protein TUM20983_09100 [Mycolicibacterium sp. TUM20983]
MKILVATALTQGTEPDDYNYCVAGELVWIQEPCDWDRNDPRGPCGCGRGFAGAASHRATTTATVVESDLTREDVVLAFRTSLADGGWPADWAEELTEENVTIARRFPVHSVIGRELDGLLLRAVWVGGGP